MRGQQTCPLTIHFNMWTVSSDVSTQRSHWQPLSVHLWAYYTQPTHEVNDVMSERTTPKSTSPTFSEQWCGFFYVPQEPDKCKCSEKGPTVFRPYPRRLENLQTSLQRQHFLLSYLKTWVLVEPEFEPVTFSSADHRSPNWANQAAVYSLRLNAPLIMPIAFLFTENEAFRLSYLHLRSKKTLYWQCQ